VSNVFECDQDLLDDFLRFANLVPERSVESDYRSTVDHFRVLVKAKSCLLYVLDPDRRRLSIRVACGLDGPEADLPELEIEGSKIGRVVRSGSPELVLDLAKDPEISERARDIAADENHRAAALAPIELHGGIAAAALFYSELPKDFSLERLGSLANTLALMLDLRSNRAAPERLDWILQHAAHSLRSPLDGIVGLIDETREQLSKGTSRDSGQVTEIVLTGKPARRCRQLLTEVESEVGRGDIRIETILLSRPGSMSITESEMAPVRIGDLVERCADRQRLPARKRGIKIVVRDDVKRLPEIFGDETLLDIAFDNVIENARKYGDDDQPVEITGKHVGGQVRIRITDRGLRIPVALEDSLFKAYSRPVQSAFKQIKGTGLGLEITRAIVARHGGSITTESVEDPSESRGRKLYDLGYFTTFEVVLPTKRREQS